MNSLESNGGLFGWEEENINFGRRAEDRAEIESIASAVEKLINQQGAEEAALYVARHLHALHQRGNEAESSYARADWEARHDPLTGLPNRRAFDEMIERRLTRGKKGSILVFDLDDFRDFNTRFGHQGGDEALKLVAAAVETFRQGDIIARTGGDEFSAYIEGDELAAIQAAVRIGRNLQELGKNSTLAPTLSIGIAGRIPGESLDAWKHRADSASYAVKGNGKNGVGIWGTPTDVVALSAGTKTTFTTTLVSK